MSLDPRTPVGDVERIAFELKGVKDRLSDLESPSGTSVYRTVEKLTALVEDIQAQLDDYIANGTYNKAQIDAKIASPGNIAPGNITSAGIATLDGGIFSADVKARTLAVGYDSVYIDASNRMGKSPSARRFKQDEEDHDFDPDLVDLMQGKSFRLIGAVEELGEEAPVEVGYIADDLDAIGLDAFVRRDDDGQISGLAYERIVMVAIDAIKDLRARVAELETERG